MEGNSIAKKTKTEPPKNLNHNGLLTLLFCLTLLLLLILIASFPRHNPSGNSTTTTHNHHHHHLIKTACNHSPNPLSCTTTLSTTLPPPHPRHSSSSLSLRHLLAAAISHTLTLTTRAKIKIKNSIPLPSDLTNQQLNALRDCNDMIDQTLYELAEASSDLRSIISDSSSYANLKTLLSAAMTNENTCIDGFSDLEASNSSPVGVRERLEIELAPISRMISNCLAVIKYIETTNSFVRAPPPPRLGLRSWMTSATRDGRRLMMGRRPGFVVVVAKDGSGDCGSIGEAIAMAPDFSKSRFLIKIKAGMYEENVEVGRNKTNIMLVGDGMQSTVIASSRSFVDGFSTFTSATLTVMGDKFLARDITIVNRAGPEKHQAVALRATSTSAFFRCNISSYQDTLYVHSLRQFYRECVIEGTIDFIFGNAAAIFQNCLILVKKPIRGQRNMITAQGREDPNQNTGISMQNCTIAAAPEFGMEDSRMFRTFLGRPWRNYSRTVIMNSYIGELVHQRGWCRWNKYSNLDTVEYIEVDNFGPGSDTRRRVRWRGYKKKCSVNKARKFSVKAFLHGFDDWLGTTGLPFFHGP